MRSGVIVAAAARAGSDSTENPGGKRSGTLRSVEQCIESEETSKSSKQTFWSAVVAQSGLDLVPAAGVESHRKPSDHRLACRCRTLEPLSDPDLNLPSARCPALAIPAPPP